MYCCEKRFPDYPHLHHQNCGGRKREVLNYLISQRLPIKPFPVILTLARCQGRLSPDKGGRTSNNVLSHSIANFYIGQVDLHRSGISGFLDPKLLQFVHSEPEGQRFRARGEWKKNLPNSVQAVGISGFHQENKLACGIFGNTNQHFVLKQQGSCDFLSNNKFFSTFSAYQTTKITNRIHRFSGIRLNYAPPSPPPVNNNLTNMSR